MTASDQAMTASEQAKKCKQRGGRQLGTEVGLGRERCARIEETVSAGIWLVKDEISAGSVTVGLSRLYISSVSPISTACSGPTAEFIMRHPTRMKMHATNSPKAHGLIAK